MKKNNSYIALLIVVLLIGGVFLLKKAGPSTIDTNTQTAGPCVSANPTVNITTAGQSSYPNQPKTYQVYVKNNNSSGCAVASYVVEALGATQSTDPLTTVRGTVNTAYLVSGTHTTLSFAISPNSTTAPGSYPLSMKAYNNSGGTENATSSPVNHTVLASTDTIAPTAPSNLHVVNSSGNAIAVSWNASTDATGIANYEVFNGTQSLYTIDPLNSNSDYSDYGGNGTMTYYNFNGLLANHSYQLRVIAHDFAGNASPAATLTASTSASPDSINPSTPSGVSASTVTDSTATISWASSADSGGVWKYEVYSEPVRISNNSSIPQMRLCLTSSNTCTVKGLTSSTRYKIYVVGYDISRNSAKSASVSVNTAQ